LLSEVLPVSAGLDVLVEQQAADSTVDFDLDLNIEELDMLFFALPDAIPQEIYQAPAIIVADASLASKTAVRKQTYGVCKLFYATEEEWQDIDSRGQSLEATSYMMTFLSPETQKSLEGPYGGSIPLIGDMDTSEWFDSFKITVLRAPKHGKFVNMKNAPYGQYYPDLNYVGKDRFDLLIEGHDDKGRLIAMTLRYYINVLPRENLNNISVEDGTYYQALKKYCGTKDNSWRISSDSSASDPTLSLNRLSTQLASIIRFSDLPGPSLAQTTGTGASAQITLDTDAAGHGWFIDHAPYLNEKFLPTSSPYEWIAQPGSNAEFTNATFEGAGTGGSVTGYVSFENGMAILKGIAGPR
jgi:hypothetical protein